MSTLKDLENGQETLKSIENSNLENIDSSRIQIPKYYNFFTSSLKRKYDEYKDPRNISNLTQDDIKLLNKLIAFNKYIDFDNNNIKIQKERFWNLGVYFDSLSLWLQINNLEFQQKIKQHVDNLSGLIKTKNKILGFFNYSSKNVLREIEINSPLTVQEINTLRKTKELNQKSDLEQITNIAIDEDVGLITSIINSPNSEFGKTLYLTIDKEKVFPFRIEKNSPIKITYEVNKNTSIGEFVIGMSDSFTYESSKEEMDITLDHNFGTRNLNIQVFNIVSGEVDLKYPTYPNIEFPSDNQIKLYLSEPRRVHVLISK